jgi:DNA helicase-2/ATP-dependent DNA helicase PcrA
MVDESQDHLSARLSSLKAGSVIAAAGCGKTEQITLAVKATAGRKLILTHTHAGVDVIRNRLIRHGVRNNRYHLDTIGAWCLRYAASYPKHSLLDIEEPRTSADWRLIYGAAHRLIESGAVDSVLTASYTGVFVDEYQDCDDAQHAVMTAISRRLPTCVFGDHMQAIFDFNGHAPIDWESQVFPKFPKALEMTYPWRWHRTGNVPLAEWLEKVRTDLELGRGLDFRTGPVSHKWLPDQDGPRRSAIIAACQSAMQLEGRLIVIADPANLEGRAQIAKALAKQGFSNVEPIDCKALFDAARKLDKADDGTRLEVAVAFLEKCMTGTGRADFLEAVRARRGGRRLGAARFGDLLEVGNRVSGPGGKDYLIQLFDGFQLRPDTYTFRREMFFAMRSALTTALAHPGGLLVDAVWVVQNRMRHAGRNIPRHSVGSTLLVKGLEFENSIIIYSGNMNRKDWYVALTRATGNVTVLSPQKVFKPPE